MVDALADLNFVQQISKKGLCTDTTKCCGSGTHDRVLSANLQFPWIAENSDSRDPEELRTLLGRVSAES